MKQWAPHGTMRRYRQGGCDDMRGGTPGDGERCGDCQMAAKDFRSQRNAGMSGLNQNANVTVLDRRRSRSKAAGTPSNSSRVASNPAGSQSNPGSDPGPTELAVYAQLEPYRAEHPVRVEMALTAARILDNPERVNIHTPTMRQMNEIIDKLTAKKKTKSGGRMAAVSAMAGRKVGG